MINYNYFKFLLLYEKNKNNLKSIIGTFFSVFILISFETYLLSSIKGNMDFLNNNFFKLFIILPCLLNINIYWISFRNSNLYQTISLIPIQLREFLTTANIYIFISNT
ncbi:hypothetical protein ACFTQ7_23860, partial [Lysinibacillus sp. NPDC056959]|uniref:hypothetical protein n=1 Tax=Lysinibacillus sp. NPDC056959 TaxID=3345981 RepID=UPI003636D2FC